MKNSIFVALGLLCLVAAPVYGRTSKDKEAMDTINARMIHIEKSIANISEMVAQQIQNFMVDITLSSHDKDCCHKILEKLDTVELLLAVIIEQLALQKQVIGNTDDPSVDEQDFNSVSDIDNAQLTVISWLKTIFRRDWVKDHIS